MASMGSEIWGTCTGGEVKKRVLKLFCLVGNGLRMIMHKYKYGAYVRGVRKLELLKLLPGGKRR